MSRLRPSGAIALVLALAVAACGGSETSGGADATSPIERSGAAASPEVADGSTSAISDPDPDGDDAGEGPPSSATLPVGVQPRPAWLGTRDLPLDDRGFGIVDDVPSELLDRRFATDDVLPPPTDATFAVAVTAVPDDVVARSTWTDACPVDLDDLRYVTVPFWGFDERLHTGELMLHRDAVDAITTGLGVLFDRRFPIEEMRVTTRAELDAHPTGDGNNTSAFVCRPSVGSTSWSQHAYGLAVDVNPFHNPYVRGELVIPELAVAYVDRTDVRPGMLSGDVVSGFDDAGWGWGGRWRSTKDWMHFSANGG